MLYQLSEISSSHHRMVTSNMTQAFVLFTYFKSTGAMAQALQ